MVDFYLLKVKVKNRLFSVLEKEHPLTKWFEILRMKIGSAVRVPKNVKSYKKAHTLLCTFIFLEKFYRNQILLSRSMT